MQGPRTVGEREQTGHPQGRDSRTRRPLGDQAVDDLPDPPGDQVDVDTAAAYLDAAAGAVRAATRPHQRDTAA